MASSLDPRSFESAEQDNGVESFECESLGSLWTVNSGVHYGSKVPPNEESIWSQDTITGSDTITASGTSSIAGLC